MRLGKIYIDASYIVDLDDEDMVAHAKEVLCEDIYQAGKYNETDYWIKIEETDPGLYTESDIPDFLMENLDEEED